jgi:hypothetical protein
MDDRLRAAAQKAIVSTAMVSAKGNGSRPPPFQFFPDFDEIAVPCLDLIIRTPQLDFLDGYGVYQTIIG